MTPETQHLLYADETGELEGIFEVQLMEPVPAERIAPLRKLLGGEDIVAWNHALLVLLAWGDEVALAEVEHIAARDETPFLGVETHRLHGADLTYDHLAHALSIGVSINGLPKDRVTSLARQFLDLSQTVFFLNGLEDLVSTLNEPALIGPTETAIAQLLQTDPQKGSDLLPALATMDPERASALIKLYRDSHGLDRTTGLGIARALTRIPTATARQQLEEIANRNDLPGASDLARDTLRDA